jgi:hypothetical protein
MLSYQDIFECLWSELLLLLLFWVRHLERQTNAQQYGWLMCGAV